MVLERLKESYDLSPEAHKTKKGEQVAGVSRANVQKVLQAFGEERPFLQEGGRTNRGAPVAVAGLLEALRGLKLDQVGQEERLDILTELQRALVERVQEFHAQERLQVGFDPSKTAEDFIAALLECARVTGKEGPVAQYLVGAKLDVRFPEVQVSNESFSTADQQLGRPGDYVIEDAAFHVTVSPAQGVYDRCQDNLKKGLTPYVLVPYRAAVGARQNAESAAPGRITVRAIEQFVAQNIEELGTFKGSSLRRGLRALLARYNERVDAVEHDKSLLIEIPPNL